MYKNLILFLPFVFFSCQNDAAEKEKLLRLEKEVFRLQEAQKQQDFEKEFKKSYAPNIHDLPGIWKFNYEIEESNSGDYPYLRRYEDIFIIEESIKTFVCKIEQPLTFPKMNKLEVHTEHDGSVVFMGKFEGVFKTHTVGIELNLTSKTTMSGRGVYTFNAGSVSQRVKFSVTASKISADTDSPVVRF